MGDDSKQASERYCKEVLGNSKQALGGGKEVLGHGKEALGDGKEAQEKRIYDEVHEYLTKSTYSNSATKAEKATVRRRAINFQVFGWNSLLHWRRCKKAGKQINLAIGPDLWRLFTVVSHPWKTSYLLDGMQDILGIICTPERNILGYYARGIQ